jgi:hypothetical protein
MLSILFAERKVLKKRSPGTYAPGGSTFSDTLVLLLPPGTRLYRSGFKA